MWLLQSRIVACALRLQVRKAQCQLQCSTDITAQMDVVSGVAHLSCQSQGLEENGQPIAATNPECHIITISGAAQFLE